MSSARKTIAILTNWTDDFPHRRYLIQLMARRWQEMGFGLVVVTEADPFTTADVAVMHSDLSVMSPEMRRLAQLYPRVVNGKAFDIRKNHYSGLRVTRHDQVPGPVIVKTLCNGGAGQEFKRRFLQHPCGRLLRRSGLERFFFRQLARAEALRPWSRRRMLNRLGYAVFPTIEAVPAGVWDNPNLLVERFISERQGDRYCCRHWLFFGNQDVMRRTLSAEPIVKCSSTVEPASNPVPEELREHRRRLGIDYGKLDYAILGGQVFLYDANTTPGAMADSSLHANTIDVLAKGILDFLPVIPRQDQERTLVTPG